MPRKHGRTHGDTLCALHFRSLQVVLLHQHGRLAPRDFDPAVALVDQLAVLFVQKYDSVSAPPYIDEDDPEHLRMGTYLKALNAELKLTLRVSPVASGTHFKAHDHACGQTQAHVSPFFEANSKNVFPVNASDWVLFVPSGP